MRITYDREVDALYIRFGDGPVTTRDLGEGIAADFDAAGHLAGIEILDVTARLDQPNLLKEIVLENLVPPATSKPAA